MARQAPRRRVIPGRRRRQQQAPRERAKLTDWVQALSGLVAMVVAVPALWVAVVTYRDQQEITRSQLELAELEHERDSRRFASRVAVWWVDDATPSRSKHPQVRVQNRSPVPVTPWYFRVTGFPREPGEAKRRGYFPPVADVPPCTVVTFALLDPDDFQYAQSEEPPILDLWFLDPETIWLTGRNGLLRESDTPNWEFRSDVDEVEGWAAEVPGTREVAADCGEGG